MKKITLLTLIFLSHFGAFCQDLKNEVSISFGLSLPTGEHINEYAQTGFFIQAAYKRTIHENWKLTVSAFTGNMKFNTSSFLSDFNKSSSITANEMDATRWKVTSLNLGSEWKFYNELYLILGLNLYDAKYPELNLYLANNSTIGVEASTSSGIGANIGLGYNFKLGSNERLELPVQLLTHYGNIDYGDLTFTNKNTGDKQVETSNSMNYVSFNLGAGISIKF